VCKMIMGGKGSLRTVPCQRIILSSRVRLQARRESRARTNAHLRHQQGTAIFGGFNFGFQMLTGMFIPLQILPPALRTIGIVALPHSFGMDLLRHYVMGTRTVIALPYEWAVLLDQVALCGLLAQLTVRRLERTARDQGLHYL